MTTARDLVYDAMYAMGALGQGDVAPSDADAQLTLRALNRMLDSWANDNLMVYATSQETIALTANDGTYTTLNLSTPTRPAAIESAAFVRLDGFDFPLRLVTAQQFDRIGYKPATGIPGSVWYVPAMTGTFEFYPIPSEAMTAYFNVRRVLTGTLTLASVITLPPGYEAAIVDNLAVNAAPSFGKEASVSTLRAARASKASLQRQNYVPLVSRTPFDGEPFNIIAGA